MIHQLTLNPARLSVAKPCKLFAQTCRLFNRSGMLVYRSVLVKDTDAIFAEVREFIETHQFRLVRKGIFIDVDMMFGEGEWSIYVEPARSGDKAAADIDPRLIDEMRREALRIAEELVNAVS